MRESTTGRIFPFSDSEAMAATAKEEAESSESNRRAPSLSWGAGFSSTHSARVIKSLVSRRLIR